MKKYIIIILCALSLFAAKKAISQCLFVDGSYFCLPSSFLQAGSINWTSLNDSINASGINWDTLNQDVQAAGVNWTSVINRQIKSSGINWDSLVQNIGNEDINWDDLNQDIRVEDINWTSIPNYSDGKTLKARPLADGGINWE